MAISITLSIFPENCLEETTEKNFFFYLLMFYHPLYYLHAAVNLFKHLKQKLSNYSSKHISKKKKILAIKRMSIQGGKNEKKAIKGNKENIAK